MNYYKCLFDCLVDMYQKGIITMTLECNGIIYDNNFHYNKDILTADSTIFQGESFVSDGETLAGYISKKAISLTIKFK